MNKNNLKIGVVGSGGMGTVHMSSYAHINNCQVVAVVDPIESSVMVAEKFGVNRYVGITEMLAAEEIDVVDVCTPTFLHKEPVLAALNAGKHVICEKPVALSVKDAEEMFNTAEKKGVGLHIGQVLQYAPETKVLRRLVREETYGKPLDAQFLRLSSCPKWIKNGWLFDKEKSGLLPFDLHIHDLDLMVHLFGKPKTVQFTSCGNEGLPYKEHYRFLYGYENMNVVAEAAWYNANIPFTTNWRVYFENALVISDEKGLTAYPADEDPHTYDTEEKIKIPTGINVPPTGIYYEQLTDFLNSIRLGGVGCPRREELLIVLDILESME